MLRLSDIMTRDVATVTPETTLREAVELFTTKHISGAPVITGHQIVGVVSASDILEFAATMAQRSDSAAGQGWGGERDDNEMEFIDTAPGSYFTDLFSGEAVNVADHIREPEVGLLDAHTVDEVMTCEAIMLSPNDNVIAAADLMGSRSIHRVLVADGRRLVGIVSTLDLARAVAEQKLTTKTYVFSPSRRAR